MRALLRVPARGSRRGPGVVIARPACRGRRRAATWDDGTATPWDDGTGCRCTRRPFDGTPAELRQTRATGSALLSHFPEAHQLARTVRALREPVERSLVVGSAPRSGRRAPPVACRCAGSPTSSVIAPPGRRLPSGPIGERGTVELRRRSRRRQWPGWRRAALAVRKHGWVTVRRAAVGRAQVQLTRLGRAAVQRAQEQLTRLRRAGVRRAQARLITVRRVPVRLAPHQLGRTDAVGILGRGPVRPGRANVA